ncbi:MAG: RNA polymerase sigma-70 factor [Cytophagales bacterium]|nr:RNA polymerase sigma-70 factor [Cytophagales bacterium]
MKVFKDLTSFESIYKSYYKQLCGLAFNIIGDQSASEDVVQNLFIKIWNKRDMIVVSDINAYVKKSTINASLNYLKSSKSRTIVSLASLTDHSDNVTEKKVKLNELQQRIDLAIKRLPPKCQLIFNLSRFEHMSGSEIAKHLGVSKKTVDNQIGIALKKLREELKPYLIIEGIILAILWILYLLLS